MRYYSTTLCTNIERGRGLRLLYALFFFIPKANPDFEPLCAKSGSMIEELLSRSGLGTATSASGPIHLTGRSLLNRLRKSHTMNSTKHGHHSSKD